MTKQKAATMVATRTPSIAPENDRARFIEVVEVELMSLHEGNMARFQIRPDEFARWQQNWH